MGKEFVAYVTILYLALVASKYRICVWTRLYLAFCSIFKTA